MNHLRVLTIGVGLFVSASTFASNPVSWSVSPANGFPTTAIGHQSQVTYTLTNNLPLPVSITPEWDAQGGNFHVHDFCQGQSIASQGQCKIVVAFAPKNEGHHAIQMTYSYHKNSIPLPALTTSVSANPSSQSVIGSIYGLPGVITLQPQQTPDFTITYTNNSNTDFAGYAGDAGGNNKITTIPAGKATIVILENNCGTPGAGIFTLKAKQSCTVKGRLTPVSTGQISIQGLYTYGAAAKTVTPTASTEIQTGDGSCNVSAFVRQPLAKTVYQYSDNLVKYEFKNTCSGTAVNIGQVSISSSMTPSSAADPVINLSSTQDSCSGKTLAALSSCYVLVSVTPQATGSSMSVKAKTTVNSKTASAVTAAAVAANSESQHVVHFNNQCSFNVWYGIANGTGGLYSPDPTPNSQNGGASPNAYLVQTQAPGIAPAFVDLAVTEYQNGAIWPRINCELNAGQFVCESGMCNTLTNSGTCVKMGNTLAQPIAPYTKFEFTIVPTAGGDGVYDVSVINGMTVPVEIKGLGPTDSSDPFTCTGTGAPIQNSSNQLGSCPWMFDPSFSGLSTPDFVWVTAGADDACANDGACAAGEVCGMAFDVAAPANPSKINRRCGHFLGYSTAANYYGYPLAGQWGSQNLYTQFNIGTLMSTINPQASYGTIAGNPATFGALLACTPTSNNSANTCYSKGSNLPTCCGCVNWNDSDSPVKTAVSQACDNINNDWTNTASTSITPKNAITWLKKGCPTAYSYQFDDKSSSYTCTNGSHGEKLMTSYQITFCPGGLSGLPAGASEYR